MKFLHTGDWHLGKTFYEKSLLEDQQYFLEQLEKELFTAEQKKVPYDALIVSGDIYDRAIPPSEAVTLFSKFLTKMNREFPELHMFFLSGNHDSAERLSFAEKILESQNIHFCTSCSSITVPVLVKNCAVYQLPFLTVNCVKNTETGSSLFDSPLRSQQDLLDEAVKQIIEVHKEKYSSYIPLLSAHLFVTGAKPNSTADGTQAFLTQGTADEVSIKTLAPFAYTALGHLHSYQKCGGEKETVNAYYSGSPLSYTFGEVNDEKYFLSVEIPEETDASSLQNISSQNSLQSCRIEKIKVKPLHKCERITDSFETILESDKYDSLKDCYIQIICTDSTPVTNPVALLQKKFPYILSFTYSEKKAGTKSSNIEERRKLINSGKDSIKNIFKTFLKDIYGEEIFNEENTAKETELFEKTAKLAAGGEK